MLPPKVGCSYQQSSAQGLFRCAVVNGSFPEWEHIGLSVGRVDVARDTHGTHWRRRVHAQGVGRSWTGLHT